MRKSEQAKEQLVVKMLCAFLSVKTGTISVEDLSRRGRLRTVPHYLALFIAVPSLHSSLRLNEIYEVDMRALFFSLFLYN